MRISFLAILVACIGLSAFAGEPASPAVMNAAAASGMSSDLTLDNFLTEGWDQSYTPRVRADGTQDVELRRVTTASLKQEIGLTYEFENDVKSYWERDFHFVDAQAEMALNRRLSLAVADSYEWINTRARYRNESGMQEAFLGRLQLVETEHSAYSFHLTVDTPDLGLRIKVTTLNYGLAGWNDLTPFGLPRVGLYYSVSESVYLGPPTGSGIRNDLTYAVSLAKTWTGPAGMRDFTTFIEAFANSALDGRVEGRTNSSLTAGISLPVGKSQTIIVGVVIPTTKPRGYEAAYELQYVFHF